MEVQERLYTVDDVLELQARDSDRDSKYELIDGVLIEMPPSNLLHAWLASRIDRLIGNFAEENDMGFAFVEGGFTPPGDRYNLRGPDVAFVSKARMPDPIPQRFAGFMPDLAVEIASPSNSARELREKAAFYLANGAELVWILYPDQQSAEVCRLEKDAGFKIEVVNPEGELTGREVLPGFELPLRSLFPAKKA